MSEAGTSGRGVLSVRAAVRSPYLSVELVLDRALQ
jgi:hypothetical protein